MKKSAEERWELYPDSSSLRVSTKGNVERKKRGVWGKLNQSQIGFHFRYIEEE